MEYNNQELEGHFNRNEIMWKIWQERGVDSGTELTVNFHFYSTKQENMELLCVDLAYNNIDFEVRKTRTLIFLRGWEITANIKKKWTLPELQVETRNLFIMSKQAGVSLDGCGALMSK